MSSRFVQAKREIRFVATADGVSICYARTGSGYTLVKAANWMTPLEHDWQTPAWGPWLNALSRRYTVIRYDPRGSGLSDRNGQDASLETFLADFEAVANTTNGHRFAILGIGQGGAVAVAYAARHPERVSHLVLTGAYVRGSLRRDTSAKSRDTLEAMVKLVELGWGQDNPAFRQFFATHIFPDATSAQLHAVCEMQRISTSPEYAARLLLEWSNYDATAFLPHVRCPTLVMHCRGDSRVPIEEAQFIAASIKDARFLPLDTRNHVPLPQEPAFGSMIAAMEDFLPHQFEDTANRSEFGLLTPRQREILTQVARGLDNREIAQSLGLSEKTVRNNSANIYDKLGVSKRAQAIVRARDAGLGS